MKNSQHKMNHKRNKLVRKNMRPPYNTGEEPHNIDNLKKENREKKLSQELDSLNRNMKRKKAKCCKKKRSKRQNSSEVDYKTEPEHIHLEGTRWMQVVRKQAIDRGKRLVNKVMKRR